MLRACASACPPTGVSVRGEFVDVDGARLYYYAAGTRGAGDPVVFLHGFPTSGHLWADVIGQMPAGHRLVVVDLLGYGRSDPPAGRALTLRAHAARVVGLLDALGITTACVVGHELGGGVAQSLALDWPSRVSRLALIASATLDGWPARDVRVARLLLPLLRWLPASWLMPIVRAELERGYYDGVHATHSIDKYQRAFTSDVGRHVFLSHLAALDPREVTALGARLGEIVIPTAVIWGSHDPFLRMSLGARLASSISGATFDILSGARHFTPEEEPREVAEILGRLLATGLRTAQED